MWMSMLMLPFAVEKCKCHKAKRQGEAANTHRQTEARDTVIHCSVFSKPPANPYSCSCAIVHVWRRLSDLERTTTTVRLISSDNMTPTRAVGMADCRCKEGLSAGNYFQIVRNIIWMFKLTC